ncbi:MAG: permease-like cell division protein FtsX [Firmicutes bacterium]|nr:permease-like cell division protein FtsX [Bacillota bacterium]MBQ2454719.1 permease-like cell division protein FtsX [Bacillota bacterium]MBQ3577173.1 permease-like cell division protein FtsX [Bacillota bacterium]MBQ4233284.1 permease-like cell division protein FtsX [Bacillota bacterium]MBQ5436628.1 permease-like cell division protein FtsX [Bacillota bacterium]
MFRGLFHSIKEAFSQMFRNKVMSFVSILSISAMLMILGVFFILTVNVNSMTENIKGEFDTIEVFLEDYTTKADAQEIARTLSSLGEVESIEYVDRDQAMEEFKERWGDKAYLLDTLSTNPLPNSLRVKLSGLEGGSLVAEVAKTTIGVEDVRYYQNEVNKVLNISEAIQKVTMVMIIFLIVVSIVVVSSTIKLAVMSREEEINIMKYVGATNWFVRGPMFVEGMLMGAISAGIALGVTTYAYMKVCEFFGDEALKLFSSNLVDQAFMIENLAWIFMALGVSIGAVGSIISMRRFLKV